MLRDKKSINRRAVLGGAAAGFLTACVSPGHALTDSQARSLVDRLVGEINSIIGSGASERRMIQQFEGVFERYANTQVIALRVLGADARSASREQRRNFTESFEGYMSRKYGRRFREFIGGRLEVERSRAVKSWFEVQTTVRMPGKAPFRVDFLLKEAGGRDLFFDMIIEGVSLTRVEREEIGALLDARGGDLDRLTRDLRSLG